MIIKFIVYMSHGKKSLWNRITIRCTWSLMWWILSNWLTKELLLIEAMSHCHQCYFSTFKERISLSFIFLNFQSIRYLCFNNSIKTKCSTFKLYQKVSIPHVAPGPVCNGLNYNNVLYKCCTKELVTILVEHPL